MRKAAFLLITILIFVCLLPGCRFSLLPEAPQKPDIPAAISSGGAVSAAVSEADGEVGSFPWGWVLGTAIVGLGLAAVMMFKAPTLVDEILLLTGGLIGTEIAIKLAQDVWSQKWKLMFLTLFLMALIGLWKIGRKWLLPQLSSRLSLSSSSKSGAGAAK